MTELILHHFPASPFAEKVRLVVAYKRLACRSVIVPNIMPKPDVLALTGGYRKTPFLQIGADIYCDTTLICDVLEQLQPTPTLYVQPGLALARILAQWADSTLFWAAVTYNRGPKTAGHGLGGALPTIPADIFADRKAMGFNVEWLTPADATPAYQTYLARLADLLQTQPYLLGQQPCIADFCAYHPLWMVHLRVPAALHLLEHAPSVKRWLERMRSIGQCSMQELTASDAIGIAAQAEPVPLGQGPLTDTTVQDEHGIDLGSPVTVAAESFGLEPSAGELVAATRTHYTLRRTDPRAGTVHVHFPRIGYVLKRS